jgi:hypothetical protein
MADGGGDLLDAFEAAMGLEDELAKEGEREGILRGQALGLAEGFAAGCV